MKKVIISIVFVLGLVFVGLSIRANCVPYDALYTAEHNYKLCKQKNWSDTTMYKNEFIERYQALTYDEQQSYKAYREQKDAEERELQAIERFTRLEAIKMLNE